MAQEGSEAACACGGQRGDECHGASDASKPIRTRTGSTWPRSGSGGVHGGWVGSKIMVGTRMSVYMFQWSLLF